MTNEEYLQAQVDILGRSTMTLLDLLIEHGSTVQQSGLCRIQLNIADDLEALDAEKAKSPK